MCSILDSGDSEIHFTARRKIYLIIYDTVCEQQVQVISYHEINF